MEGLIVGGMLAAIFSGFVAYTASIALRQEITSAAPEYAVLLFRSLGDQVIFHQLPVRLGVLWQKTPPHGVRPLVPVLRWAFGVFCVTFAATVGFAVLAVSGVAA